MKTFALSCLLVVINMLITTGCMSSSTNISNGPNLSVLKELGGMVEVNYKSSFRHETVNHVRCKIVREERTYFTGRSEVIEVTEYFYLLDAQAPYLRTVEVNGGKTFQIPSHLGNWKHLSETQLAAASDAALAAAGIKSSEP